MKALLLTALLLAGCQPPPVEPAATQTPHPEVSVKVERVMNSQIRATQEATGTIAPWVQVNVSAVQGGLIKSMPLWTNLNVSAGETLATLDLRDQSAQREEAVTAVGEAEAALQLLERSTSRQSEVLLHKDLDLARAALGHAQALYERRQVLYARGGLALKDLQDTQLALTTARENYEYARRSAALHRTATLPADRAVAEARVRATQARVRTLDAPLSFAEIRSPLTGTVLSQAQFEGEFVAAGTHLLTLADLREVLVKAQFPDLAAARLRRGQAVEVRPVDRPGVVLAGRISLISQASDPQSRTVEVWTRLANRDGQLRAGGFAVVRAQGGQESALVVPQAAVTLDATDRTKGVVMVVDADRVAHEREVEGESSEAGFRVNKGLKAGETIVVEGNYALPDGTRVTY